MKVEKEQAQPQLYGTSYLSVGIALTGRLKWQQNYRVGNTMPKRKRVQREHTEDWQTIQQYTLWPEQTAYELLRPVVLFGDPAGKRAQETETAESTLDRKADTFDEQGMVSLFASRPRKQHKRQHGVFRPICVS
jgi:hypothetical protein